jgi:small GTP-binding protein
MNNQNLPEELTYEILPDDYTQYDLSFKLIVIGDSGVGKSCLTLKATKNIFENNYNATVGFEFFTFNIKVNDKVLKLQIWDTCGQEIYRSLITNFYRNSSLAIMVYAIDK